MKVAVATKDGRLIDEHFGHAKFFDIYEMDQGRAEYLERRDVDHYCHGGTGDKSAMMKILDTIEDCSAVFVARIGDGPIEKLEKRGILAVYDYPWEEVPKALSSHYCDEYAA